jgi:hypothetical protein
MQCNEKFTAIRQKQHIEELTGGTRPNAIQSRVNNNQKICKKLKSVLEELEPVQYSLKSLHY